MEDLVYKWKLMPVTADPTEVSKSFAQRRIAILFVLIDEAFWFR